MSSPFLGSFVVLMANVALVIVGAYAWHCRRSTEMRMASALVSAGDSASRRCGAVLKAGASRDWERRE